MMLNVPTAHSVSATAFRQRIPIDAPIDKWQFDHAVRHTIGWFDYDSTMDAANAVDGGNSTVDGETARLNAKLSRDLAIVLQPPLAPIGISGKAIEWHAPLLPYQRDGVVTLLSRPSLLLADAMGLGKTIQAIAALRILHRRDELRSGAALVVCPAGLVAQWRAELSTWAPELRTLVVAGAAEDRPRLWRLRADVKLVGYETLRADILDRGHGPARKHEWEVVVLDEASRIKNRRSSIAVACKLLNAKRRWALTGTPVENSLDDAVSILDFVTGDEEVPSDLPARLRTHQLRRQREDVLDQLPPKQVVDLTIELSPGQREAYRQAERDGIFRLTRTASVTIVHILELISRLKQICNYDPTSGESSKLADIQARMTELVDQGERALIFSQFTDRDFGVGKLDEQLREFEPIVYTGQMSQTERERAVQTFARDRRHKALLLSLRAGGQGLNLQSASYVFHFDRWWNPAIEEQADSRAHRMGQTKPVTVYRYTCSDTIEERIDAKLRDKRLLFTQTIDNGAQPDLTDLRSTLTEAELYDIIGITRDR